MQISLTQIIDKIVGKIEFVYKEENLILKSKEEVIELHLDRGYSVESITARGDILVLEMTKWKPPITDMNGEWVKEHIEKYGEQPSFF